MRNDVHQPLNFEPSNYRFVQVFYQYKPTPGGMAAERARGIAEYIVDTFGEEPDRTPDMPVLSTETMFDGHLYGQCNHCGAAFNYGAIFYHQPSGQYVRIGWECATKRFTLTSHQQWQMSRIKNRVHLQQQRALKMSKARTFILVNCPELSPVLDPEAKGQPHPILADLSRRLLNYGTLSEKQVLFAHKLVNEAKRRAEQKETETLVPVVAGEGVEIEGRVLCVKSQPSHFGRGTVLKMTILDKRGFKVWGTVPGCLDGDLRGCSVKFVANVKASGDNPCFGFFNFPRKAEVIPS